MLQQARNAWSVMRIRTCQKGAIAAGEMNIEGWLWKYLGWLKPVPEPFKTIIFIPIVITITIIWPFVSLILYFKNRGKSEIGE